MSQITPDQLQALLNYASRKLGMTPEQLASTVQQGGLSAMSQNLGSENTARIAEMMGDSKKTEEFLNSPEVKQLLGKLLGGNG